jgi:hypothetical protein
MKEKHELIKRLLLEEKLHQKITDIVTDLIRDDISKQEAIDNLLILYNVR